MQPNSGSLSERWNIDERALARVACFEDWVATAAAPEAETRSQQLSKLLRAAVSLAGLKLCGYTLRPKRFPPGSRQNYGKFTLKHPSHFLISSNCLTDPDGWRVAAQFMISGAMQWAKSGSARSRMALAITAFLADPAAFDPAPWEEPEQIPPAVALSAGELGGSASGADGRFAAALAVPLAPTPPASVAAPQSPLAVGNLKRRREPQAPRVTASFADTRFVGEDTAVRPPAFEGPQSTVPGGEHDFDDLSVTCRMPEIEVLVQEDIYVRGEPRSVLFDIRVLETEDTRAIRGAIHQFIERFDAIAANVGLTLRAPGPLPVLYVVCGGVLGFNFRGGVYINLWPLIRLQAPGRPPSVQAEEAFLQVLLHEIAHWHVKHHDENFANYLAALVYQCRFCLK